jgi:hypothetical protein
MTFLFTKIESAADGMKQDKGVGLIFCGKNYRF